MKYFYISTPTIVQSNSLQPMAMNKAYAFAMIMIYSQWNFGKGYLSTLWAKQSVFGRLGATYHMVELHS